MEKDKGTVPYTVRFTKFAIFINTAIFIFCFVLSIIPGLGMEGMMGTPSVGLWPIYMMELVI